MLMPLSIYAVITVTLIHSPVINIHGFDNGLATETFQIHSLLSVFVRNVEIFLDMSVILKILSV